MKIKVQSIPPKWKIHALIFISTPKSDLYIIDKLKNFRLQIQTRFCLIIRDGCYLFTCLWIEEIEFVWLIATEAWRHYPFQHSLSASAKWCPTGSTYKIFPIAHFLINKSSPKLSIISIISGPTCSRESVNNELKIIYFIK